MSERKRERSVVMSAVGVKEEMIVATIIDNHEGNNMSRDVFSKD